MYEQNGLLVNISESGACVRLRAQQPSDAVLAFIVRWDQENILLRGRVVRSTMHRSGRDAVIARVEHDVGVEFHQHPPQSVDQLQRLAASAR
jgi:hypothetical protein